MLIRKLLLLLALFGLAAPGAALAKDQPRVLVFSYSTGYRHASIEAGVAAFKAMGPRLGVTVVASEDPAVFSTEGLKDIATIVLMSTTTKPGDPASEWFAGPRGEALQAFIHRGGGIVAVHAAADSHYGWPWYGRMIGGHFARHPKGTPTGRVTVFDPHHPITRGLASPVTRADEWYYFDDYDPTMHLLATVDPASIGEADVNPNPVAWAHEFEGGRVFYTALGHTPESFSEPWFVKQLEQGLAWTLRR